MQPAGRIDQYHVHLPSFRGSNPIECDGGRIGSMAVTDHGDADSVSPDLQLIDCRSAKRIGSDQQRHFPCLHKSLRDFGNCSRLTDAIDPYDQNDEWPRTYREQGFQRQSLHRRQHVE
jgi:hypothetical protein